MSGFNATSTPPLAPGRCWIVQNSWGTDVGYNGYWLINMDTNYDCGLSEAALVPLLR